MSLAITLTDSILNSRCLAPGYGKTSGCDVNFYDVGYKYKDNHKELIHSPYSFQCKDYWNNIITLTRTKGACGGIPSGATMLQFKEREQKGVLYKKSTIRTLFLMTSTRINDMVPVMKQILNPMFKKAGLRELKVHDTEQENCKLIEVDHVFSRDTILMNTLAMLLRSTFYTYRWPVTEDYDLEKHCNAVRKINTADGKYIQQILDNVQVQFFQKLFTHAKEFACTGAELRRVIQQGSGNKILYVHPLGVRDYTKYITGNLVREEDHIYYNYIVGLDAFKVLDNLPNRVRLGKILADKSIVY